jgi:hypothetical protein
VCAVVAVGEGFHVPTTACHFLLLPNSDGEREKERERKIERERGGDENVIKSVENRLKFNNDAFYNSNIYQHDA